MITYSRKPLEEQSKENLISLINGYKRQRDKYRKECYEWRAYYARILKNIKQRRKTY